VSLGDNGSAVTLEVRPDVRPVTAFPLTVAVSEDCNTRAAAADEAAATLIDAIDRYLSEHGPATDEALVRLQPAKSYYPEVLHLAIQRRASASTQNQALCALVFLYRKVLEMEMPALEGLQRAQRPEHLPNVLSRGDVRALLDRLEPPFLLLGQLLYGAGQVSGPILHLSILQSPVFLINSRLDLFTAAPIAGGDPSPEVTGRFCLVP